MRRFKNILSLYDDSIGADDVLTQSVELARANNARLTLIDVVPSNQATEARLAERRKKLSRLKPVVEAEGIQKIETHAFYGTPFLEVVRQVLRTEHDLVIASAEGGSKLQNVFFGSTATHLMRKAPCPVWIVKPGQSDMYRRILACVDPVAGASGSNALNHSILRLATSLAKDKSAALHVVHAWDVEGKDRDTISSEITDFTRTQILTRHENTHRQRVDSLLADHDLSDIAFQVHLPRATPEKAIIQLVEREDIDLVVMGTISRTGIPGLIIGNAAETVLSAVKCSILTVKPEGFVSPVQLEQMLQVA
jgi:nucleotide-binding universal stress UspA family protein